MQVAPPLLKADEGATNSRRGEKPLRAKQSPAYITQCLFQLKWILLCSGSTGGEDVDWIEGQL